MRNLYDALVERLEELGLHVKTKQPPPSDNDRHNSVHLELSRSESRRTYALYLERSVTLSDFDHTQRSEANAPLLLGAVSVSSRSADGLRRAGVQYIDTSGNAWIHFDGVLIDVRGRRTNRVSSEGARPRGGNLFSTARAQVAFALLQWPHAWKEPQRELAKAAGVSLGQANDALKMFRDNGFGPGGHRTALEFLDLWAASFPSGLGEKLLLGAYQGSIDRFKETGADNPILGASVVSGELAADELLRPRAMTLYVDDLDPMLPVENRWRADGDPNITVRRKFWTTPPGETRDDDGPPTRVRTAPSLLVYADLLASDNPRARSVAQEWRDRIARAQKAS